MKEKPGCTGQRFGRLVVLGRGGRRLFPNGRNRQTWRLQCDCGNIIERVRGDFDNSSIKVRNIVSCGCKRKLGLVDNNRRPKDITGERFDNLTAIRLTGSKVCSKPTWLLQCDCGLTRELSLTNIKALINSSSRLNCGNSDSHPDRYFHYPLAPTPYPKESGDLVVKYLHLTKLHYKQIDSAVEDHKLDRLLRAAWIITYRRQQGEAISELHESRISDVLPDLLEYQRGRGFSISRSRNFLSHRVLPSTA